MTSNFLAFENNRRAKQYLIIVAVSSPIVRVSIHIVSPIIGFRFEYFFWYSLLAYLKEARYKLASLITLEGDAHKSFSTSPHIKDSGMSGIFIPLFACWQCSKAKEDLSGYVEAMRTRQLEDVNEEE